MQPEMIERMTTPLPNGQDREDAKTHFWLSLADSRKYPKPTLVAMLLRAQPNTWYRHHPRTWNRDNLICALVEARYPTPVCPSCRCLPCLRRDGCPT